MRRVVVTGLSAITPLGVGIRHTWRRLLASECGIVHTSTLPSSSALPSSNNFSEIPSQVAGIVPLGLKDEGRWTASEWMAKGDERRMAKFTQYAIAATEEALQDAGWKPTRQEDQEVTGVCLGSGIGNFEEVFETSVAYNEGVSFLNSILLFVSHAQEHIAE